MTPTQALFWKEWRQIQWRWILCMTLSCLFVYIGLRTRIMEDEAIMIFSFLACAFPIPLFIAMGLFAEEREDGSMLMQLALPVSANKIYLFKILLGIFATITPIATVLVITLIMAGNREQSTSEILRSLGGAAPFGAILMLWTVVFSMKRKTQWAAALTGIAIAAAWILLICCEDFFFQGLMSRPYVISWIITPWGFLEICNNKGWQSVSAAQAILSVIMYWYGMKQFSSLTRSGK